MTLDFFAVFNPTLIEINSFIKHYYFFKDNPMKLIRLLHSYSQHIQMCSSSFQRNPNVNTFLNQGTSFDEFLEKKIKPSVDYSDTFAFNEAKKRLFPE